MFPNSSFSNGTILQFLHQAIRLGQIQVNFDVIRQAQRDISQFKLPAGIDTLWHFPPGHTRSGFDETIAARENIDDAMTECSDTDNYQNDNADTNLEREEASDLADVLIFENPFNFAPVEDRTTRTLGASIQEKIVSLREYGHFWDSVPSELFITYQDIAKCWKIAYKYSPEKNAEEEWLISGTPILTTIKKCDAIQRGLYDKIEMRLKFLLMSIREWIIKNNDEALRDCADKNGFFSLEEDEHMILYSTNRFRKVTQVKKVMKACWNIMINKL